MSLTRTSHVFGDLVNDFPEKTEPKKQIDCELRVRRQKKKSWIHQLTIRFWYFFLKKKQLWRRSSCCSLEIIKMCFPVEGKLLFTYFVILEKNCHSHTEPNPPGFEVFLCGQVSELHTGLCSVMKRWQCIIFLPKAGNFLRNTSIWHTNEVHRSKGHP